MGISIPEISNWWIYNLAMMFYGPSCLFKTMFYKGDLKATTTSLISIFAEKNLETCNCIG